LRRYPCRQKSSTSSLDWGKAWAVANSLRRFVAGLKELAEHLLGLKQLRCPKCGAAETLNCHSKLYGNDPQSRAGGQIQRGQRVWCSDRGQRGGCGGSFSIFLAEVLPRHTVRAGGLWSLLERLLAGGSLKAAAEALGLPFALESLYHLRRRMRLCLASVRSALYRQQPPPASSQADGLLQTAEHLRCLFPQSGCPAAEFQLHFQRPLLE
jgi:hypothetical protein